MESSSHGRAQIAQLKLVHACQEWEVEPARVRHEQKQGSRYSRCQSGIQSARAWGVGAQDVADELEKLSEGVIVWLDRCDAVEMLVMSAW